MRTKTHGVKTPVKNIFDAANQHSWFSLLYFGRTVQAPCYFPSGKLLVWRGGYSFFFFFFFKSNAHAIRSASPGVGPQANRGDIKLAEPKDDNFPRGWWKFGKQSPLVHVFLKEKCP